MTMRIQLSLPGDGSRKRQVPNVGASDQQDKSRGGEQRQEGWSAVAGETFAHGNHACPA
jgi:hypothetical protein